MLSTIKASGPVPAAVTTLYEGFANRDPGILLSVLDPSFTVSASAGMPLGVGRRHAGAVTAVTELWGVVHTSYDIAPIPDEAWTTPGDTVVVHGWYEGTARRTGEPVRAEFVHLLRVEGDLLVELRQITDTVSWGQP
jgi:ketosteroid isomerase-like protein